MYVAAGEGTEEAARGITAIAGEGQGIGCALSVAVGLGEHSTGGDLECVDRRYSAFRQ